MTGLDKARETAKKIKKGIKKEAGEANKAVVEVTEHKLQVGAEVAEFYRKNANVGSENISRDSLPGLKVTESNSQGLLADGSRPTIGSFYYTETKEEFKTVEISMISVSKGFYVRPMDKTKKKMKFQQIISGMILDGMKPFVMYVSGKRLQGLWDLGGELSPFTKHKEMPVPMMAFKIGLSTTSYKHENGVSHYINFEIMKDESNQVQLITDLGVLELLRGGVESMEAAVESIISATGVDRQTGELLKDRVADEVELEDSVQGVTEAEVEEVLSTGDDDAPPF